MLHRLTTGLLAGLLLLTCAGAAPTVDRATVEGALAAVARPEGTWNGGLLLLAPGLHPDDVPLSADLDVDDAFHRALLSQGWMIATTSYRRTGVIVADAMEDLDRLHAWVAARYGEPRRTVIEGKSMGGLIAVLLAERDRSPYDGVVAIGAALDLREPSTGIGVNLRPRRPVVFLSNQTELEAPRRYAGGIPGVDREIVHPVVFRVSRDGHVNVNAAERLYAFRALLAWLDRGRGALPPEVRGDNVEARQRPAIIAAKGAPPRLSDAEIHDATQVPAPRPSEVLPDADGRGLVATVVAVTPVYGNVTLNVQVADLDAIGLRPGAYFQLRTGAQTVRVLYGRDFSSVERGQWVLFPSAEGYFWLARNFANAATSAGLSVGDAVHVRRYEPQN